MPHRRRVILSINAGSSSVKISVFTVDGTGTHPPKQIAETQIDGLTAPPCKYKLSVGGESIAKNEEVKDEIKSQDEGFKFLLDKLISDPHMKDINKKEDITHICHRVVHGGNYTTPQIVTKDTYDAIQHLTELAPLHNAAALTIIRSCIKTLPNVKNIAYFDSQFHQSIPEHIHTYPIDQTVARNNHLRKFGFHGISYSFITREAAKVVGKGEKEVNLIALHLGSGASACAIKAGRSWDTSMGLTPLAGLPGATRSGSVDPSLVFHYASDVGKLAPASTEKLHISRAEEILNKESGWKALAGTTNFGEIAKTYDEDEKCKLAFDIFVDRICGFVGSYYVSLQGNVDALVFAGGIGERSDLLRTRVVESCRCLGFEIDEGKNGNAPGDDVAAWDVTKEGAKHRVLVCRTDEQFEMARGVAKDSDLVSFRGEDGVDETLDEET
jgi:acetate kinase